MNARASLLLRILVAAGASASVLASWSCDDAMPAAASSTPLGTGAGLPSVCTPSDEDMGNCSGYVKDPDCCQTRCYAAIDSPPYPDGACLREPSDGGSGMADLTGTVDASAGECLSASNPATSALLGNHCGFGPYVAVIRDGTLPTTDGGPSCCYPVYIGETGRPLVIDAMSRVAPLHRTTSWT